MATSRKRAANSTGHGEAAAVFEARVTRIIEREGFKVTAYGGRADVEGVDMSFDTDRGEMVGVICKSYPISTAPLAPGIQHLNRPKRMTTILVVAPAFSNGAREALRGQPGVHAVVVTRLRTWISRYLTHQTRRTETSAAARVKNNKDSILMGLAGLAALIEEKLEDLRRQKPNSEEGITTLNAMISDYEKLKAEVDELREAVEKFIAGKIKEPTITKKATSFGEGVANWWSKGHEGIVSTSYSTGMFLSAVALCSLIGVNPTFAAGVAGVLVGGKTVAGALKSLTKKLQ